MTNQIKKVEKDSKSLVPIERDEPEAKMAAFAKILAFHLSENLHWKIEDIFPGKRKTRKRSFQEETADLVKDLLKHDVDIKFFDVLLSNEMDRRLKIKFGVTFLLFTLLFTSASYAIVVLDGIYNWGISEVAITALIIETPIQFVGLLYIIARNLFPRLEKSTMKKDN